MQDSTPELFNTTNQKTPENFSIFPVNAAENWGFSLKISLINVVYFKWFTFAKGIFKAKLPFFCSDNSFSEVNFSK